MRLNSNRSRAPEDGGEITARKQRRRKGRGWGPFSGGQLTIVVVAIAAVFAIPTAALAAGGAFSNNSASVPAVQATNANAHGIGVQGTGKKYGVFSKGPLGVAAGKPLTCAGCIGPGALSTSAKRPQPLRVGQTESGSFGAGGGSSSSGYIGEGITFVRPSSPGAIVNYTTAIPPGGSYTPECPGAGQAALGYLCLYESVSSGIATFSHTHDSLAGSPPVTVGEALFWQVGAPSAEVAGTYTVQFDG